MKEYYLPYSEVISANGLKEVNVVGNFLSILSTTGASDIFLQIGDASEVQIPAGISISLPDGEQYNRLKFRNSEASQITIKFATSIGQIYDNRNVIAGTVTTQESLANTLTTGAAVSVPTTAPGAASVAANTATREVWIQNNGSFDLWFGDANVDGANNRGQKILPGGSAFLDTTAAVYLRANGGTTTASIAIFTKV